MARAEVEGTIMSVVVSSNVAAIGYNDDEEWLYIEFHDGSVYKYYDVGEETWSLFQVAPSKGKFVWSSIRDIFEYEKLILGVPSRRTARSVRRPIIRRPVIGRSTQPKKLTRAELAAAERLAKSRKRPALRDITRPAAKRTRGRRLESAFGKRLERRLNK